VAQSAIEAAEALLALAESLLDQTQVVRKGRLLNEGDRQKKPMGASEQLATTAGLLNIIRDA